MFRMWRSKHIFVLTYVKSCGYLNRENTGYAETFSESLKFKPTAQRISFCPENNNNKKKAIYKSKWFAHIYCPNLEITFWIVVEIEK